MGKRVNLNMKILVIEADGVTALRSLRLKKKQGHVMKPGGWDEILRHEY